MTNNKSVLEPFRIRGAALLIARKGHAKNKEAGRMPVVNVELQVIPGGVEDVYGVVDSVIAMIADSGVKYVVGPMGTTMEGELPRLLALVEAAQALCVEKGASRVLSVVKIDYKPEGSTIDEKIAKYRE
jgi:uncharacterized protein (TIGR00106 family)